MWTNKDQSFSTPQPEKNRTYSSPPSATSQRRLPGSENSNTNINLFHVIHKLPAGDSPYVRAKHVQLVEKNPSKAVSMFWAAINSGDRVDSALKDMAVAMKQLNRSDEAIEAIKSFRHLCPLEAQEPLDNILLESYKRSGRIEEQIHLLELKLKHIENSTTLNRNKMRLARSQGKKIQITMGQEYSRLLGNLAWAYLQQDKYKLAEETYRKALSLEPDKNKQCNLAICLMYMNKISEAKFLLRTVKESKKNVNKEMEESHVKSYDRAIQVMHELESEDKNACFSSFLSRNNGTDAGEEGKSSNNKNTGLAYCSPFPTRGMPRTPFTQPRQDSDGEMMIMPLTTQQVYCDENVKYLDVNDGYRTQARSDNRLVKRSLTFGKSQTTDGCRSVTKVRMRVFQDITFSSESRG